MDESDIPRIKIFDLSDESLKLLGELLTNESSRSIIMTLIEKQMYVNQLAEKLDMRVSLVIHHLKKLGELGLLDIVEKPISKRTKDHKFFRINTDVFLSFTIDESGNKLKKIFNEGIKFASIGITAFIFWSYDVVNIIKSEEVYGKPLGSITNNESLILSLTIIIIGLITERIFSFIKKKKRG